MDLKCSSCDRVISTTGVTLTQDPTKNLVITSSLFDNGAETFVWEIVGLVGD